MNLVMESCTYRYARRRNPVLEDFNYRLPEGLTVLLGPNGAGKSTLLKLAASVIFPQEGAVTLGRIKAGTKIYRKSIAWMPQDIIPIPSLNVREYVAYIGWLKGMNRNDAWQQALRALERVKLRDKAEVKTSQLSGGQLRRVGVAGALVHNAQVLLLDEPTAGLDPHQRRVFREILGDLTQDVKVLLSTHDVADLAEEASHVTVLHGGRILHDDTAFAFMRHTPPGVAAGRAAEGAYTALLGEHGLDY